MNLDFVGFATTIVLVLIGIIFQRTDARELRQEMVDLRKEMAAMHLALSKEISELRTELRSDYIRKA